jgi:hypothetical protein
MSHRTLTLTLVAALAAGAFAAPAALARPDENLSPQARNAAATAKSATSDRVQDLRRLRAAQSLRRSGTTASPFTPGYTPGEHRGREAYYHHTPPVSQQPTRAVSSDDGAPWTMIALGLAGACLLVVAMVAVRRARLRTHVAA